MQMSEDMNMGRCSPPATHETRIPHVVRFASWLENIYSALTDDSGSFGRRHRMEAIKDVACLLTGGITLVNFFMIWIVFWKFVVDDIYVGIMGDHLPNQHGGLGYAKTELVAWMLWLVGSFIIARMLHRKMEPAQSLLVKKLYFVIIGGMIATISSNVAHLNHSPSAHLFDVGFYFIPEFSKESFWRKVNDVMTVNLPIVMAVATLACTSEERRRVLGKWGELSFYGYIIRASMVPLTSLPGPAPHCAAENYNPPHFGPDMLYRLGPVYGNFNTCGDLIPSGHAYWCTTTLLLVLSLCTHKFGSKNRAARFLVGFLYLFTMAVFTIASRKHYTIDIFVGTGLSYLMFHFCTPDRWLALPSQELGTTTVEGIIVAAGLLHDRCCGVRAYPYGALRGVKAAAGEKKRAESLDLDALHEMGGSSSMMVSLLEMDLEGGGMRSSSSSSGNRVSTV